MFKPAGRVLVLCGCMMAIASTVRGDFQKGVSLTLWGDADMGQLAQSLDNMVAVGVDHVAVNVWWFQQNIRSTTIAADFGKYSAHDDSVRAVIDAIHARNMGVMLKPMLDLSEDSSHWRGEIVGGSSWFTGVNGYGSFINHFADIAQQKNVEILCVGAELGGTTAQAGSWRKLVTDVRSRYGGKLTYAANHGGSSAVLGESISWWDQMDYFGIDAYYPLTGKADPTLAELKNAWASKANQIQAWRNAHDPRKPVLFTEVGYRSANGANKAPWSVAGTGTANADQQEQADCYEALFSQLWPHRDWFGGLYWWNWNVDPDPTWEDPTAFTAQGKLAQQVIQKWYTPGPDTEHPGDANGDGSVDVGDLGILGANYDQGDGKSWATGDFTGDQRVDGDDLGVLSASYGWPGVAAAVPEPGVLGMVLLGGLARRWRRR